MHVMSKVSRMPFRVRPAKTQSSLDGRDSVDNLNLARGKMQPPQKTQSSLDGRDSVNNLNLARGKMQPPQTTELLCKHLIVPLSRDRARVFISDNARSVRRRPTRWDLFARNSL